MTNNTSRILTLADRAAAYAATFPRQTASHLTLTEEQGRAVLYGRWLPGADYRNKTRLYGAFPPTLLARIMALFPDMGPQAAPPAKVLHAFSGSLPPGPYVRLDLKADYAPDVVGNVYDAAKLFGRGEFALTIADPPYSAEDARRYGTPGVDRGRATAALAEVTSGYLVWLDTVWPLHSKRDWRTVGRIAVMRSTNHRLRELTIFERS